MGWAPKLSSPVNPKLGLQKGSEVINLTKHLILTKGQLQLLNKGLTFIPTPVINQNTKNELLADTQRYHRRLLLAAFYRYNQKIEIIPFTGKSTWTPKLSQVPNTIRQIIRADKYAIRNIPWNNKATSNLGWDEKQALRQLRNNRSIVIKPADKGSAVVIMDRQAYIKEAERQLNQEEYYKKLSEPIFLNTVPVIRGILTKLREDGFINKKQETYLMGPDDPRPRYFYLLPKIHKEPHTWSVPFEMPPGRPIVSDCGSETQATAEYVEYFLNPISSRHPSYVRDTYDFIEKVKNLSLPPDCFLFTIDIDSLYTNIETPSGMEAVRECFARFPDKNRPDEAILKLLEINLTRNDFEFNSRQYLQVKGTAMGKKFAPSYANIFMAKWEEEALASWQPKPLSYYRFLDDIWGIWTGTEDQFKCFTDHLDNFHRSIKIKYTLDKVGVNFLDTVTFKGKGFLETGKLDVKVYFKDTDTHALLHKSSYHPRHTFRGIVKSQIQRFHRICTQLSDFLEAKSILFRALRKRGYSRSFLRNCVNKSFEKRGTDNKEMIPLITTFSGGSVPLNRMMKHNFHHFLTENKVLDSHKIISAYRKNKNLKDMLVRSRLPPSEEEGRIPTPPSEFRPKRWITNPQTKAVHEISPALKHDTVNCVYLIYCTKCNKQYVGETSNSLAVRLTQHRYNLKNRKESHTLIVQHFMEHGSKSLKIMGLQHNRWWSNIMRKKAERVWINRLSSMHPWGLNEQSRVMKPCS